MKLANRFVREEKPCTKAELFKMFGLSAGAGEELFSLLLSCGVLVPVRQGVVSLYSSFVLSASFSSTSSSSDAFQSTSAVRTLPMLSSLR